MSNEMICISCELFIKENSQLIRENSFLNSELMRFKLLIDCYEKYIQFLKQIRDKNALINENLITEEINLKKELNKYKSIKSFEIKANIVSQNNSKNNNNNNNSNNNNNNINNNNIESNLNESIERIDSESCCGSPSIDKSTNGLFLKPLKANQLKRRYKSREVNKNKNIKLTNILTEEKIICDELMKKQMNDTKDIMRALHLVTDPNRLLEIKNKNSIEELLSLPQIELKSKLLRRYYSRHLIIKRIESKQDFDKNNFYIDFSTPFNIVEVKNESQKQTFCLSEDPNHRFAKNYSKSKINRAKDKRKKQTSITANCIYYRF
jgi:hypothetical protein